MYYNNSTLLIDNDTLQYNDEGKIYYTKEAVAQKQKSALQLNYSNNISHLASSNVQDAIDELAKTYNKIDEIQIEDYSYNSVKLVSWSDGTDEEITKMIDAFYNDEITLNMIRTVWNVGDTRIVHINETGAFPIDSETESPYRIDYLRQGYHMRNQPEQDIKLTIIDFEYDNLTYPINNHEKALITLMMLEPFEKASNCPCYNMNMGTYIQNWNTCIAKRWLNINLYESFDRNFSKLIKPVKKKSFQISSSIIDYDTGEVSYDKETLISNDYIWIPSVNEFCNPFALYTSDFTLFEIGNPYLYFYNTFIFDNDEYFYSKIALRDSRGKYNLAAYSLNAASSIYGFGITEINNQSFSYSGNIQIVLFGICI